MLVLQKGLILPVPMYGGSYFFIQPRFCERYEPCKMVKKDALLVYLQRRLFLLFYRATALQRGNSFPSCAWRNILFRTQFS